MANFNNIKHEIDQNVNTNGVQAITGAILNETLKDMIDEVDDKKQDTLVAGSGIAINGNVISATGGSGQSYTAGEGIDIDPNNVISVDASDLAGDGLKEDSNGKLAVDPNEFQEKLTAGANIQISGSTISATDTTYSAGQGLDLNGTTFSVDYNEVQEKLESGQNIKTVNGYSLLGSGDIVIGGGGGGNYLPLEGGTLQNTAPGEDTELKVIDGMDEDYVKIVAPESQGEEPHIEIFENGSGDTKIYYDHIERGAQTTINYPSESGTLALTSDIPEAGSGLIENASGEFEVDTTAIQEKLVAGQNITIQGNVISASGGSGQSYVAGNGIDITGNTISVDNTVATTSDLSGYLPLTGGILKADSIATGLSIKSPSNDSTVFINSTDTISPTIELRREITNPTIGDVKEVEINQERLDIFRYDTGNVYRGDSLYFPQFKTGTIALDTDLAGKQDTLVAGANITIQGNVISATGGGSGSYTAGNGINISGSTISVDENYLDGEYLPLSGGLLKADPNDAETLLDIAAPDDTSAVSISTDTSDSRITLSEESSQVGTNRIFSTQITNRGNVNLEAKNGSTVANYIVEFPQKSGTIALTSDLAGKQDTLTAGTGITIQNNVISATGGSGSGLWVSGEGTNSLKAPATAADPNASTTGVGSLSSGISSTDAGHTRSSLTQGDYAVNFGKANQVAGDYAGSIGYGNSASGDASFAIGSNNSAFGNASFAGGTNSSAGASADFAFNGTTGSGGNNVAINGTINGTGYHNFALNGEVGGSGSNPNYSTAIGRRLGNTGVAAHTYADNSIAIGGTTDGAHSIAIGGHTINEYEIGIGPYNKTYGSNDNSVRTSFTVGNGSSVNGQTTSRNVIEVKKNDDLYVSGVGGFDGTNSAASDTLQDVLNGKQDQLTAGTGISIQGNVISATGGGGGSSYSAGPGITIDQNNEISANPDGTNIVLDSNDQLSLEYTSVAGNLQGTGLQVDSNTGASLEVDFSQIPSQIAGNGLQDSGNGTLEVDYSSVVATLVGPGIQDEGGYLGIDYTTIPSEIAGNGLQDDGNGLLEVDFSTVQEKLVAGQNITISGNVISASGGGSGSYVAGNGINISGGTISVDESYLDDVYLPLTGGIVKAASGSAETLLDVSAPDDTSAISMSADTIDSRLALSADINDSGVSGGDVYRTVLSNNGRIQLDEKTVDPLDPTSITTTSYTLFLPQQNDIIATRSDISSFQLWTSGVGDNSLLGPQATTSGSSATATGDGAISVGKDTKATANYTFAGGQTCTAAGHSSISYGRGTKTNSEGEAALGKYNSSHIYNGTAPRNYYTRFSIGNGSSAINTKNSFEVRSDDKVFVYGLGGYQGDGNDTTSLSLQDVVNGKQDTLTAGTGITITNNVISASGGGGGSYSAGAGLSLTGSTFSVDYGSGLGLGTNSELQVEWSEGPTQLAGSGLSANTQTGQLDVDFTSVQGKLTAGSGITISGNTISATGGGGSSLWTSGTGTGSVMSPGANQANGNNSISAGDFTRSNGTSSVALGGSTTATGLTSVAIGANSTAAGSYSVALGHGLGAANTDETALGKYNNNISTGTSNEKTFFTIGNGTGTNAKSNLIEAKENSDIYVYGIGGFDGTNSSGSQTLQDVINNNWILGGGQYSLMSPGANSASGNYSIAAGYDSQSNADYSVAIAGGICAYDDSDPDTIVDGNHGVAIGEGAIVEGEYGIAIGKGAIAGSNSLALGEDTNSQGYKCVAVAGGQTQIGNYNFGATTGVAEGNYSVALSGGYSVGEASLAMGDQSISTSYTSVALGLGAMTYDSPTIQNASDPNAGEIAVGRYNYSDENFVFSVGCGIPDTSDPENSVRQNAITITNDGKIFLKGLGGYTGTSVSGCTDLVSFLNNL